MFRRLFWFAAGIAAGVWATMKVNRAARRLAPDSLAATAVDRAAEIGGRARQFTQDVRTGMTQRETELTEALGLGTAGRPQLPGPRPPASPTGATVADDARREPQDHQQKEDQ